MQVFLQYIENIRRNGLEPRETAEFLTMLIQNICRKRSG